MILLTEITKPAKYTSKTLLEHVARTMRLVSVANIPENEGFELGVYDRHHHRDDASKYHGRKQEGYIVGWSMMDDLMKAET